ncbi:MAG: hypothetical protein V3S14_06280 [Anaerolineae bacterium]
MLKLTEGRDLMEEELWAVDLLQRDSQHIEAVGNFATLLNRDSHFPGACGSGTANIECPNGGGCPFDGDEPGLAELIH